MRGDARSGGAALVVGLLHGAVEDFEGVLEGEPAMDHVVYHAAEGSGGIHGVGEGAGDGDVVELAGGGRGSAAGVEDAASLAAAVVAGVGDDVIHGGEEGIYIATMGEGGLTVGVVGEEDAGG